MTNKNQLNDDLIQASQHDNLINVKSLIEQGADIHTKDDESLIMSARYGHLEVVKYLLEQGSDVNAQFGQALKLSTENGHLEVVKYLVEHGADIHSYKDQALRWSAENGHLEVVKYLIIDCNMVINKKTVDYLKKEKLLETLNIINTRDLHSGLNNNLSYNPINNNIKLKI
jgi:ankyrin repeat protein